MCASIKDVLRAGGRVSREVLIRLAEEHEALLAEVRRLRRREGELEDRLRAEKLHRQAAEKATEEREQEVRRLRQALAATPREEEQSEGEQQRVDEQVQASMQEELEELRSQLDEMRKRAEKMVGEARRDEQNRLSQGMGQLLDSLARAIEMSEGPWREGLEAIEAQFERFLKEEGVELIGEVGDTMDPHLHNAVDQVDDTDFETGQIAKVLKPGFQLQDGTVIREADVVVAK